MNVKTTAFAATLLAAGTALPASISIGDAYILASQQSSENVSGEAVPHYVSVNPNNAGFAGFQYRLADDITEGTDFQVNFTDELQGYRFVNRSAGPAINTVAEGGSLNITMTTTDLSYDSFGQNGTKLWTTNDPGANLLSPSLTANFTGGIGIRDISNVSGSIDITDLASGTVWFIYGGYNSTPSITGIMADTDGPELDLPVGNAHIGDNANQQEMFAASFDFVNDAGYDSIDYTYTVGTRWVGIMVTGTAIPEPSAALLGGLGFLALLRRRR
jgi:hypothetical protein